MSTVKPIKVADRLACEFSMGENGIMIVQSTGKESPPIIFAAGEAAEFSRDGRQIVLCKTKMRQAKRPVR